MIRTRPLSLVLLVHMPIGGCPFGLCNAPTTFQRYMLCIFSDMVERIMEVYMDDITVYGQSFDECLVHLETVLHRCIEKNLVLNWEKFHFMVNQGIVLGHIISERGIEGDKAKVELISKFPSPTIVKTVRHSWDMQASIAGSSYTSQKLLSCSTSSLKKMQSLNEMQNVKRNSRSLRHI